MSKNSEMLKVKNGRIGYGFIKGFKNLYGFTITSNDHAVLDGMPILNRFDGERQLAEWTSLIKCLEYFQKNKLFSEFRIMSNLENIPLELDGSKNADETAKLCGEAKKLIEQIKNRGHKISIYWIPKNKERKFNDQISKGEIPSWLELDNKKFKEQLDYLFHDLSRYRASIKTKTKL